MQVWLLCVVFGLAYSQSVPCGQPAVQPITTRIVGGQVANVGSWPWTVLVVDALGFIAGTGAIIHPNVILTSAQHFQGLTFGVSDLTLSSWKLYAGEHNIYLDDPHEATYGIADVKVHANYDPSTLLNDVALIITSAPITFNNHTSPACLPDSGHTYTVGETCYLPGWGSTASTGNEEVLNQVDLPILDDAICQSHWTDFLPDTELCAGYENQHKDFCGDDIGSPLMCQNAGESTWFIQGIASSGGNCRVADEPGIFEDVSKYEDWIKNTMAAAGFPYAY